MDRYLIDLEHDVEGDVWVASWNFDEGSIVAVGHTATSALKKFAVAIADWTEESAGAETLSEEWRHEHSHD